MVTTDIRLVQEAYHRHEVRAMRAMVTGAETPAEAIMLNRMHRAASPVNQVEMSIREDNTKHQAGEVGRRVVHGQRRHIKGMTMGEVSNKIINRNIQPFCTSQSQNRKPRFQNAANLFNF